MWYLMGDGGRCATRTRDLWFRRPTLYPPELIAHEDFVYHLRVKIKKECILVITQFNSYHETPERGEPGRDTFARVKA